MRNTSGGITSRRLGFRRLGGFELLEQRHLMAGDAPDSSSTALVAAAEDGTDSAGFERFSSAQELKDYLLQAAITRWQNLFGQRQEEVNWIRAYEDTGVITLASTAAFAATNVQVAGVDEADLVKTDGDYLYLLRGSDLLILDARPAAQMQIVSHTQLTDAADEMYLHGDRLTVIARVYENWQPSTQVNVYDISDRSQPVLERSTLLDGSYRDSRQVADRLVFIMEHGFELPRPEFIPDAETSPTEVEGDPSMAARFSLTLPYWHWRPGRYETQAEYVARVEDQILELALPGYRTLDGVTIESQGLLSEATEIYRPLASDPQSLISMVVLDASGEEEAPLSSASVPITGWTSEVYATAENFYVLRNGWSADSQTTTIHKFHLGESEIELVATGTVAGTALNQFSIDEHEGFLRIATTEGWGNNARNHVYVLEQEGNDLNVAGQIEEIAPGERIFAVRFLGDRGFVVTFRQIDPLFAIDFSDPTRPRLAGELHIPGFSNYLHPVGENHLIGIGRDADLTGRQAGLQVSLFDVSNLAEPRLVERYSIDAGPWASSQATFDHKAVGYFSQTQTLAIPVQTGLGSVIWSNGSWEVATPSSEMWVFQIDVSEGLSLAARIEMEGAAQRSLQIDDALYFISTEMVMAASLTDPNVELAVVDLVEVAIDEEPPLYVWPVLVDPVQIEPRIPEPTPGPEVVPDSEVVPEPLVAEEDIPMSEPPFEPSPSDPAVIGRKSRQNPDPQPTNAVVVAAIDVIELTDTPLPVADANPESSEFVVATSIKRAAHVPITTTGGEQRAVVAENSSHRKGVLRAAGMAGRINPVNRVDALFASDSWL